MFDSESGAMVDAAVVPQVGCRTLCQHPGCFRPIQELAVVPGAWVHIEGIRGPEHDATPVEPEYRGEKLIDSVKASYDRHLREEGRREGLTDFAKHLRGMATRGVNERITESLLSIADIADRRAAGEQ